MCENSIDAIYVSPDTKRFAVLLTWRCEVVERPVGYIFWLHVCYIALSTATLPAGTTESAGKLYYPLNLMRSHVQHYSRG